ncbi:ImpA family metalloprotease [Stenotrophobium rhamnosiphilum]|uniref:Peptidase M60 domain-containing protein n=1 Tax=Stenotrophobium rhamnosiphilum TaxID=2029166 RepID=A0A2T5MJX6_9GAMM|nr:ImpA family metalloprotease [Stenotrophobium rhamnosiphilum]PTU32849.1 hypothetical protein CJD38_01680 [Stenotrophobium rhamnosiphilum]
MSTRKKLAITVAAVLLSACTGADSVVSNKRVDAALASGDPSGLQAEDRATLLQRATSKASAMRSRAQQVLSDIYNANGQVPNLSVSVGVNDNSAPGYFSNPIYSSGVTQAIPYIVSDDGTGIAAITELSGDTKTGRGMAYANDMLSWMSGTTREQQHLPLFTRAFTWLMTGQAGGTLPSTIKFSQSGYNSSTVRNFLTRLGKTATEIPGDGSATTCNIASSTNTCWQNADLLVFGESVPDSAGLRDLVQTYLKAGKAVMYMHSEWADPAGATHVLNGMGMKFGGYGGNYWASAPTYSVSAGRTAADSLARADTLAKLSTTLQLLAQDSYSKDFTTDTTAIDGVNLMLNEISAYETSGKNIFATSNTDLQRLLVLWADQWRPQFTYGQISRTNDAANFLRAYASDSWLAFNRSATTTNPHGQGDYMPVAAQQLATTSSYETIQLRLPQSGGITAIGRGAIPAKGAVIEIVNAPAGVSLGIQSSYVRATGNPIWDNNYPRPRRPNSWNLPLQSNVGNNFVSPFGGPLFLSYNGATAGQTVTLKIKGVIKYAHFDFSNGTPPQADLDAAMASLQRKDYGWSTAKFRSGEVQQTIDSASNSIGSFTPKQYVVDRFQRIVMDTNHIVSGYNDMPLSPMATSLCSSLSWDCTGGLHNPPGIQHFVSWIAACGDGCSGNPSDNNGWGLTPSWGWAHELGHNNVQRWMSILACVGECDNNTHSITAMLRGYALNGDDYNGSENTYHSKLYKNIQDSRATGKTGEALRADMQARLWTGDIGYADAQGPMLAVHMQLAFLYTKVRYGSARPTVDPTLEFMALLSKGARLIGSQWTTATAANYGMGRYPNNNISNEDLLYVLGSKIIGQDLRNIFSMYGIPLSANATNSISDLGLPLASQQFYALAYGKSNQLQTGQWLTLQSSTPAYPF